jgi:hypothetical protein
MNKKEYPLWLKIALRLPLRWKQRIRASLEMAEFWSEMLVLEDTTSLMMLVENTKTPDFEEFDKQLNQARKAWGKYDAMLEGLAVRKRLMEFKHTYKDKKE